MARVNLLFLFLASVEMTIYPDTYHCIGGRCEVAKFFVNFQFNCICLRKISDKEYAQIYEIILENLCFHSSIYSFNSVYKYKKIEIKATNASFSHKTNVIFRAMFGSVLVFK